MWFDTWTSVFRTAVAAVVAYAGIVVFLRVSGKRTLSKMNAFDLVVTVALGSTLSSIIISKDVPLLDGLLAIALLIALQLVVAWLSVRWRAFERVVKSDPTLLLHRGKLRGRAMTEQRVSPEEIDVREGGSLVERSTGAAVERGRVERRRREGLDQPSRLVLFLPPAAMAPP